VYGAPDLADKGNPTLDSREPESPAGQGYAPEEILIRFTHPQTEYKIADKVERMYGKDSKKVHKIARTYAHLGLSNTYLLKLSAGEDPLVACENYRTDPEVIFAEPNYIVTLNQVPNDPSFSLLWGLHNTGQRGVADTDIDAPEAWDICTGSTNVIIAVVDTGMDYFHPDLAAALWTNEGEIPGDGMDNDLNGYIDDIHGWDFTNGDNEPLDDHGHGTHCAGTIGAVGNNGEGITGVMAQCRIMPLKVLNASGVGYTSDLVAAILYANRMGADVISISLGGPDFSSAEEAAIVESPALIACAAGNEARNIDTTPVYPASYTCPQIVSVAAYSPYDRLCSFSNYGSISVDVAAPGESVYSTLRGGTYGYKSGTSMAAPHVSGLAGLIKAYSPELCNLEIKAVILENVDQRPSLDGKVLSGGLINAGNVITSLQPLSVTGISPSSGYPLGPIVTNLSGTGFRPTPTVRLVSEDGMREICATTITRISANRLSCTVNLEGEQPGNYRVLVNNPAGDGASFSGFTINPPVPTIAMVSPSSLVMGNPGFELRVAGTSFTPGSQITWNGSPRITTFENPGSLQALISAEDVSVPGTAIVTVVDPVGGISNGIPFIIFPILPPPTVSSIYPASGYTGTTITITSLGGTNFRPGATVVLQKAGQPDIGATNVVVVTANRITCQFDIPRGAAMGAWDVMVTNSDGTTGKKAGAFTISVPSPPTVSSIYPSSGYTGTTVTITSIGGTNFRPGATVMLQKSGQPDIGATNVVVVTANRITCQFDIPGGTATGAWDVMVTNSDGTTGKKAGAFTISVPPPPTVSSIYPASGYTGTTVTITSISGTNYRPGATVVLQKSGQADITATNVVVVTVNKITCQFDIPGGTATGAWDVMVTNSDGTTGKKAGAFTISVPSPPTVSSIYPSSGYTGTTVTITSIGGTNFRPGATVVLQKSGQPDILASNVVVVTAYRITCRFDIPATAATGTWDVVVTNSDGTTGKKIQGFRIY
jgi:hypothetical protein